MPPAPDERAAELERLFSANPARKHEKHILTMGEAAQKYLAASRKPPHNLIAQCLPANQYHVCTCATRLVTNHVHHLMSCPRSRRLPAAADVEAFAPVSSVWPPVLSGSPTRVVQDFFFPRTFSPAFSAVPVRGHRTCLHVRGRADVAEERRVAARANQLRVRPLFALPRSACCGAPEAPWPSKAYSKPATHELCCRRRAARSRTFAQGQQTGASTSALQPGGPALAEW